MIEIRPATQSDFPHLPDVEDDAVTLFDEHGLPEISALGSQPESFYRNLPATSLVLVATDGSSIVGFSVGIVVDGQAYLREVSVRRRCAKQGIGSRLVKGIVQWARTKGFHSVTLTTFRDLPFNAPFYQKLGFREFTPDDAWPELRKEREEENQIGLDIRPRIAMRLDLNNVRSEV